MSEWQRKGVEVDRMLSPTQHHVAGSIWLRALRGAALGIALAAWLVLCAAAWVALIATVTPAHAAEPPTAALEYRRDLTREARAVFGLSAPVPVFAAQIQQESAWRPRAESPYAQGLAQFVPSTADWISEVYPYLGPADVWNPQWSIRAMVRYDKHLLDRYAKPAASDCDAWAFTLSAYNGGQGHLIKDRALCRAAVAPSAAEEPSASGCGRASQRAESAATARWRRNPSVPANLAFEGDARSARLPTLRDLQCPVVGLFPTVAQSRGNLAACRLIQYWGVAASRGFRNALHSGRAMPFTEEMVVRSEPPMLAVMGPMRHDFQVVRHEVGPIFIHMMDEQRARKLEALDAFSDQAMDVSRPTIKGPSRVAVQQEDFLFGLQAATKQHCALRNRVVINAHDASVPARNTGCDNQRWFGNVENHTNRADWARKENRHYVRRILLRHQPRYRHWGPMVACDVPA